MTSKKEENSNSLDATSVTPIHLMIHDVMNVLEYETRYLLVNNSEEFLQIHAEMVQIWANSERKCDQNDCSTTTKQKLICI